MARIPLVDPGDDSVDPRAKAAMEQTGFGIHPNVYRAIANHPGALEAFSAFGKAVYFENSITAAERELAYLTASVVNNCHY
ncbi:MAG TPA: carboxymuconolactone decarboxylase family protein [Acidimicrobiales bacterium]|nr:carboxymuconolactone decarboxylase family protein [Acidimicrobiales bacterium]